MAISLCDLIPGVMNCVNNVANCHPGEHVLILSDTTCDPDVVEAYRVGYASVGGKVTVLTTTCEGAGGSSTQITDRVLTGLTNPIVVEAIKGADLMINLTANHDAHGLYGRGHTLYGMKPTDYWQKYHTRMCGITISSKEQLASDMATFPQDLLNFLGWKGHEVLEAALGDPDTAKIHITDPQGTDISLTGCKICTKKMRTNDPLGPKSVFGTKQVGILPHKPTPNAEGVIVSTSIHTGPTPEVKAYVEEGRVVKLEGGGEVGKIWQVDWEKGKNALSDGRMTSFGEHSGPGINWLEEIMWGVHPRSFRQGRKYYYHGSDMFKNWSGGIRRAGVIHFGIGGGKDEWYRHRDLEVFYPTLEVNGTVLIENGHLLLLDDPEVRELAAKYGDPDELLTERWFPFTPIAE